MIYELNGKKYLLVEIDVVSSKTANVIKDEADRLNCIYQSFEVVKMATLLNPPVCRAKILVPETSIEQFNKVFDI